METLISVTQNKVDTVRYFDTYQKSLYDILSFLMSKRWITQSNRNFAALIVCNARTWSHFFAPKHIHVGQQIFEEKSIESSSQ